MADTGTPQKRSNAERMEAKDRALSAILSMGFTVRQAGELCKMSRSTIERRLRDPAFRSRLRRASVDYASRLMNSTVRKVAKAIKRLEAVASDPKAPASARVAADKAILDMACRSSSLVSAADAAADLQDIATEQTPL